MIGWGTEAVGGQNPVCPEIIDPHGPWPSVKKSTAATRMSFSRSTGSAVLLFRLSGVDPHAAVSFPFLAFSIAYGATFAFVGGYVAGIIAARRPIRYLAVLGGAIALSGLVSLVARPGEGAIWSQLATVVLFAPLAVAGGMSGRRRRTTTHTK